MSRWPRLMKLATAAAYVDMTPAAFVREIGAGRLPCGFLIGGKEHWDIAKLDRAIDALAGGGDELMDELRKRYGKAA